MPYAAIYLPPAPPPSPAVRAVERAILDAEGSFTVAGQYFAREADATTARRVEAERRVRDAARAMRHAPHPTNAGRAAR